MPVIPTRTTSRGVSDINLGRVQATEIPGVGELTTLRQVDTIVKGGVNLADTLAARQEKRQKENRDLKVNEAFLSYQAAASQLETEFDQIKARDSEGMFLRWKAAQDKIYKNSSSDLNEDEAKHFDALAGKYGLQQNSRIAAREVSLHEKRVNDNYRASANAASINAYKELARPNLFYENINEARRLEKELLKRQGINETEIENKDQTYFSKAVKDAIIMTSSLSLPQAEAWYEKALNDEELLTNDSLLVRRALDKRKEGNDKEELLNWSQTQADRLIQTYGEDRGVIFEQIEKLTSGEREISLKEEVNARFKQIRDQTAENQRAFLKNGKGIIDQSLNSTEARQKVAFIMADSNATIDTANKLGDYINDVFEKPVGRKTTNPTKMDELYTNINKTLAGTAAPDEIISSSADIDVKYGPHLSISDNKAANEYLRNNGLFGKTAYKNLLQSFANMKEKTVDNIRKNKEDMAEFTAYLSYARPLLPPDKTVSPIELQKISADFFIAGERGGKTPRPADSIWFGIDEHENETYQEAAQRGEGLKWMPDLDHNEGLVAKKLLTEENARRRKQGLPLYEDTERNRANIYKQRVVRFNSVKVEK